MRNDCYIHFGEEDEIEARTGCVNLGIWCSLMPSTAKAARLMTEAFSRLAERMELHERTEANDADSHTGEKRNDSVPSR